MRISTRGDYACRALLSLALHADEGGPTSVRDIADRTALPQPYLEQILLALKGAGLVRSKRGVGGGYVLARPPAEIKLSEMMRYYTPQWMAVAGFVASVVCAFTLPMFGYILSQYVFVLALPVET